jgi:hypothetical protein
MNHPDTDIADAIIAGMGSADGPTEQMAAIVTNLERAGFVIRPTAEYEALMALAKAADNLCAHTYSSKAWSTLSEALATLSAAGLDLEEKT